MLTSQFNRLAVYAGKTKSAMLPMDNPQITDGERHRP
jgi:hypothetical protein